jgi:hypothetical protein
MRVEELVGERGAPPPSLGRAEPVLLPQNETSRLPKAGIDSSRHGRMAEVSRKNARQAFITCERTRPGFSQASQVVHNEPIDWVTNGPGPTSSASRMSAR